MLGISKQCHCSFCFAFFLLYAFWGDAHPLFFSLTAGESGERRAGLCLQLAPSNTFPSGAAGEGRPGKAAAGRDVSLPASRRRSLIADGSF